MSSQRASLRRRTTTLVTSVVAGVVVVIALISFAASARVLRDNADQSLLRGAQRFANGAPFVGSPPSSPPPTNPGQGRPSANAPGLYSQLISPTGTVTRPTFGALQTVALPVSAEDLQIAAAGTGTAFRDVTVDGTHLRMVTVGAGPAGAVQDARSVEDIDQTLRGLLILLLATCALGIAGAALIGIFVSRATLKPVREIADAAELVARTQDLSALIPEVGPQEIAGIAHSVNRMLVTLDTTRQHQNRLVDDLSHELRTPLTSVRANLDLLLRIEGHPDADTLLPVADRRALLGDLQAQLIELSDLFTQLVELARQDTAPEPEETVDVSALLERASRRVRLRAPGVDLVVDAPSGLAVTGRPVALERAVVNLLDNAAKFGPPDGRVVVAARVGEITVSDEGPGVAPDDAERVFDRFYRSPTTRSLPGRGLGLAIVAETAHDHGGSATVVTGTTAGALFRLALPSLVSVAAVSAGPPVSASPPVSAAP